MHAANMLLEAKRWIEKTHPVAWRRRGGRDHVWLVPNDEGARPDVVNISANSTHVRLDSSHLAVLKSASAKFLDCHPPKPAFQLRSLHSACSLTATRTQR